MKMRSCLECERSHSIYLIVQQQSNREGIKFMHFISKNCSYYLTAEHQDDFKVYQSLSGIGFNKLGFYQECIADPLNHFTWLKEDLICLGFMMNRVFLLSVVSVSTKCVRGKIFNMPFESIYSYVPLPFSVIRIQTPSLIQETYSFENISALAVISITHFSILGLFGHRFPQKNEKDQLRISGQSKSSLFSQHSDYLESRSQRNQERVKIFSGIKVISLIAIIMTNIGHLVSDAPTTSLYEDSKNGAVFLLFYGVDIWLLVSGFFISYILLKQYNKLKSTKILLLKIVRRFLRFWPLYFLSLLLNTHVLPLLGSGPLWPLLIDYRKQKHCLDLTNIFMISNFFKTECYNWLWLIQLDFQLCFIFIPVLLLYIHRIKPFCRYLFFIIQFVFVLCSILVALVNQTEKYNTLLEYFFNIEYTKENITPITRGSGFIIGYNLGIVFYHFKKLNQKEKEKFWVMAKMQKKVFRTAVPLLGILGFITIAYLLSTLDGQNIETRHKFFLSSLHLVVPLCLSLILLPSLFGYWSPFKVIFQSPLFHFLSKLSLSIYSANYMTSIFIIYYRQNDLELSSFTMIFMTFCAILPAVFISLILTTIVQIPVFVCKKVFWKTERITYFEH